MTERTTLAPVIRRAGEGEKRWFFGGGVFTWKLSSANEDIGLWEVDMVEGKWTPIHTHPVSESMWVLDGQIQYRINDDEHELGAGDFVMVPAGVPHAFIVKSRHGQGARHPADLRMRTLLPRRQRALRRIGVHRGLRPDRAERPGERRHRDRWTSTVLVRTHLPPIGFSEPCPTTGSGAGGRSRSCGWRRRWSSCCRRTRPTWWRRRY